VGFEQYARETLYYEIKKKKILIRRAAGMPGWQWGLSTFSFFNILEGFLIEAGAFCCC
jgi:hypothetical protein